MLKKFLNSIYLPTPLVISGCLFVASLVFSFCFTNPAWATQETTESSVARMGFGSGFAFLFAIWFILDCFAYFEKDMKDKTRFVFSMIVGVGEFVSFPVSYTLFAVYQSDRMAILMYILSFLTLWLISGAGIYLRLLEKKNTNGGRKENEKYTFIALILGTTMIAFMPLWNCLVIGSDGATNYHMWMFICIAYLATSYFMGAMAFVSEFKCDTPALKNTVRAIIAIAAMCIGALGIFLASMFVGDSGYPTEGCYYMVACGIGFIFFGFLALLYEELRKSFSII